jgi:hypothetical protein
MWQSQNVPGITWFLRHTEQYNHLSRFLESSVQGRVLCGSFWPYLPFTPFLIWASCGDWSWPVGGEFDLTFFSSYCWAETDGVNFCWFDESTRTGTVLSLLSSLGGWGGGRGLFLLLSGGSLRPLACLLLCFSGITVACPKMFLWEKATGRERQNGLPLNVFFTFPCELY